MQNNPIQLAVIDMAGTTVADDGLVVNAFEAAATAVGVPASGPERDNARQYVLDTMGQSKISVFRALFGPVTTASQRRPERTNSSSTKEKPPRSRRDRSVALRQNGIRGAHHRVQRHQGAVGRARLAVVGPVSPPAGARPAVS
jgi:hypothetical protein